VSAVASIVRGLVLTPLPYPDAQRIATVDVTSSRGFGISTSIPNYRDWTTRLRTIAAAGGSAGWSFRLTGRGPAEILRGQAVLGDFFRVFGTAPAAGRFFTASETRPGTTPLVVIGHGAWQRIFGADLSIVGRTISLNDVPHTVVGITHPTFDFPHGESEVYVNMGSIGGLPWEDRDSSFGTRIFLQVAAGTSMQLASEDVARVGREVRATEGELVATPSLRTLQEYVVGRGAQQLWLLLAAVTAMFLVAMANVGGLVIARAVERRGDVAVRLALGGRERDVRRDFVLETVLLTLSGGSLGLVLAVLNVYGIQRLLPDELSPHVLAQLGVGIDTILITIGACLLVGVLLGAAASRLALPSSMATSLRGGGRGVVPAARIARRALVVMETALSLVLVIEAGLLLASFRALQRSDKGFEATQVLSARVGGSRAIFGEKPRWLEYMTSLEARAKELPGAQDASLSLLVPLSGRSWELSVRPEGSPLTQQESPSVLYNIVSASYFNTLGIPVVRGRTFDDSDRDGSQPVAIVDESMVRQFWAGEDPIGKRITLGEQAPDSSFVYRTVVGVARNVRHYTLAEASRIQVYVPVRQTLERWGNTLHVLVRTSGDPSALAASLRNAAAALNADVPLYEITSAQSFVDRSIASERALGLSSSWLAAIAALMTGVGLFGIVSYAVVQRRREIAVRMALGAAPNDVVRQLTWEGVSLAVAGVAIGLVLAAAVSRALSGFLFGVGALDPLMLGGGSLLVLVLAGVAAMVPALAARGVPPAAVLREE